MKIILILSLHLLFFTLNGVAEDSPKYQWPLSIYNGTSSAFQEFRSNHFHGGIDFRTYMRTGYPVYAISDGFIYKIRMVRRGSGRGLYLKHRDGNVSIYFHLSKFQPKLEKIVRSVQGLQKKRYFGNYTLQHPVHFKKGEVIGYSGETGSGFPHLHVEIRDSEYAAINPFQWIQFPKPDRNPPVLKSIIVRSVGNNMINGKIGEQVIRFVKKGPREYAGNKPLVIEGNHDMVLNLFDISDTGKTIVPHEIIVDCDSRRLYHLRFDRFFWADNNQLGFVYDMFLSRGNRYYINLFSQTGFSLEREKVDREVFFSQLPAGSHQMTFTVTDNQGNQTVGRLQLIKVERPEILITKVNRRDKDLVLSMEKLDASSMDRVGIKILGDQRNLLYSGEFQEKQFVSPKDIVLENIHPDARLIEFQFKKRGDVFTTRKQLVSQKGIMPVNDIRFSPFVNRDFLYLKLDDFSWDAGTVSLEIKQGDLTRQVEPFESGAGICFGFQPLNRYHRLDLIFSVIQNNQPIAHIQKKLDIIHLVPGESQTFKYGDFFAAFHTNSVYEPRVLLAKECHYRSRYPQISTQVSLSPYSFPFLDKVHYGFKLKELPENHKQLGIFKYDHQRKQWRYRYTTLNVASGTFRTRVISSGTFSLMRDVFPPKISFKRPPVKPAAGVKRLVVRISDVGKGVNDSKIRMILNGAPLYAEFDPDWGHVVIPNGGKFKQGMNYLQVDVEDYGGNRTKKSFGFKLL